MRFPYVRTFVIHALFISLKFIEGFGHNHFPKYTMFRVCVWFNVYSLNYDFYNNFLKYEGILILQI